MSQDESSPIVTAAIDLTDANLEVLYLAAVREGQWVHADELQRIRRERRERAAGNVVHLDAKLRT